MGRSPKGYDKCMRRAIIAHLCGSGNFPVERESLMKKKDNNSTEKWK